MRPLFAFLLLLLALALGCGRRDASAPPTERQRQIARLQEFSQEKGMPRTGNFRRADPRRSAYYLCYSTGKWELPEDYSGLRYKESDEHGCRINTVKYDVYFHRVEAVAMVNAPVTQSLEAASDERALMVAAHEEAHEDPQLRRFPAEIAESATTLLGILTAAEFAMRDGDTATATHLSEDARTFSRKAEAVNELTQSCGRSMPRSRASGAAPRPPPKRIGCSPGMRMPAKPSEVPTASIHACPRATMRASRLTTPTRVPIPCSTHCLRPAIPISMSSSARCVRSASN